MVDMLPDVVEGFKKAFIARSDEAWVRDHQATVMEGIKVWKSWSQQHDSPISCIVDYDK